MIRYVEGAGPNLAAGEAEELHYKVHDVEEILKRMEQNDDAENPEQRSARLALEIITKEVALDPQLDFCEAISRAVKAMKNTGTKNIPTKRSLLKEFRRSPPEDATARAWLAKNLVTKRVRSESGVLVVTVLTSPYPSLVEEEELEDANVKDGQGRVKRDRDAFSCKFDCFYCPNQPGMPRSYLRDEPAVLRANQNGFDPVLQFTDRCATLIENGHVIDKIEILILGGTWSSYPMRYRETFARDLFFAANTFLTADMKRKRLSLMEEIALNETANCRIIGLTVETRPDCVSVEEIRHFRRIGCTRVQLGVQHTNDAILKGVNRGCTVADAMRAFHLLKSAGFKVDAHLMPNLPGSSPALDREMLRRMSTDPELAVDQIKVYPTEIVPFTRIEKWFREGKYKPYGLSDLLEVLIEFKSNIPPWIRLNRVVRDIPTTYQCASGVVPGSDILLPTNWRLMLQEEMRRRGLRCQCIRCREVGQNGQQQTDQVGSSDPSLMVRAYEASNGGHEFFLSFENDVFIFGFCRLRVPPLGDETGGEIFPELAGAALVRELHVYGEIVPRSQRKQNDRQVQHLGYGTRLLQAAEEIVRRDFPQFKRMCVISGVGVREFYRRLGWNPIAGDGFFLAKEVAPLPVDKKSEMDEVKIERTFQLSGNKMPPVRTASAVPEPTVSVDAMAGPVKVEARLSSRSRCVALALVYAAVVGLRCL